MNLTGEGPMYGPKMFPYRYYDHPEGTHLAYKLGVTSCYAMFAGSVYLSFELPLVTKPKTLSAGLVRSGQVCVPLVAMAAAFTGATFAATRLRGKDDELNYLFGGIAAGHVYGAAARCLMSGFVASLGFGVFGMFKKHCIDNDYVFLPMPKMRETTSLRVRSGDYTIMAERERDWTANPNEA